MTAFVAKPEVGHVLDGRYVLERVVGEGGMGVVFAARHLELGDAVAVKILHTHEASDAESTARFLREARLAAKIKSEHVVRVLDVARSARTGLPPPADELPPYIVMEYLDGVDLGELLHARGPLPVTEGVDYVLQACEGLVEAHKLGIVHRDLKPSNLLLTNRGDGGPLIKVVDFGISKTPDEVEAKLTTPDDVFGSPAYMSPEQIRAAGSVDARADVWALAVVLFELLTGRLPFVGETAAAMLAAVAADPPLRLEEHARVPAGLGRAIAACLVKDRDRRIGSVVEMASALAPFASADGRASAESVRRIAFAPRRPLGSSPALGARPPRDAETLPASSLVVQAPSLRPCSASTPPVLAAVPSAPGSDRAVEVSSVPRPASTSRAAGLVAFAVGAALIVATWAVQQRRDEPEASAAAAAPPAVAWPEAAPLPVEEQSDPQPEAIATAASASSSPASSSPIPLPVHRSPRRGEGEQAR